MPSAKIITEQRQRAPRPRAGVVYVAVMGVAMILCLVALTAVHIARVEVKTTSGQNLIATAQNCANAAVELALSRVRADSNWRTIYTSGQEVPLNSWTSWGTHGKFKFVIVDDDGNLADNDRDPITIKGVGGAGDAIAVTAVIAEPSGAAITSLEVAMHAQGDVIVSGGTLACDQFVSSNDDVTVQLFRTLNGDAWAVDDVTGNVTGAVLTAMGTAREMPDPAHVFKYYLANGVWIDIGSIPSRRMDGVVLTSTSNPYGRANRKGIYVIDCQNQTLTIQDSRIEATLVLLNASAVIDGEISWMPPSPNHPALLVQGNLAMQWGGSGGLLGGLLDVLNLGGQDSEVIMKGLTYATGNVTITNSAILQGCLIAGGPMTVSNSMSMTYDGWAANYPPPGFSKGAVMRIVPGTWLRTVR